MLGSSVHGARAGLAQIARIVALAAALPAMAAAQPTDGPPVLHARVIAVGIPGAGAVSAVGAFHPGGPIHDKPAFAAVTAPGRILDPRRVLVASTSNFTAPLARAEEAPGAILSIDPAVDAIVVPADFAAPGGQAAAVDERVALFAAQSPPFRNAVHTPAAATAALPTVSHPLGISINNAFGRLWFANAPLGLDRPGTLTIADPGGEPLAGAPNALAGGVFAGDLTRRVPAQLIPGDLPAGAVATALLGMSPDGSRRAVFAVLTADGGIAQAHTEQGVDGLAPAGTLAPLPPLSAQDALAGPTVTRAGMAFNWVPDRILYVTDPVRNAVVALKLVDDGRVFRLAEMRTITARAFDVPIDVAPAVPEVANPTFSSNTSLAGGADLYVLNRGNGTIVRLRQDGTVAAVRRVATPDGTVLAHDTLNGIAVSPDAQRIWLTVNGVLPEHPAAPGALIEVPAFGPGRAADLEPTPGAPRGHLASGRDDATLVEGRRLFQAAFTPEQGLGPLYNARSCGECHRVPALGGVGTDGLALVARVGRLAGGAFDPLLDDGGPVARAHSVAELGIPCVAAPGPPPGANVISLRNASALFGLGLIDRVPDDTIASGAGARPDAHGRIHRVRDLQGRERVGRFGWKADVASLEEFVGQALRNEIGITNPFAPRDLENAVCDPTTARPAGVEDDGTVARAIAAYVASLPPPDTGPRDGTGAALFAGLGCDACHVPTPFSVSGMPLPLYSDLLLHDMGPALDDGVRQGDARGSDWRTAPLWGLGQRSRFLHDGRATSLADAIRLHDGDARASSAAFRAMAPSDGAKLLTFLAAL